MRQMAFPGEKAQRIFSSIRVRASCFPETWTLPTQKSSVLQQLDVYRNHLLIGSPQIYHSNICRALHTFTRGNKISSRGKRGRRARATSASGAQQVGDAPVHHLGPTLSGPVWHLAVGSERAGRRGVEGRGEKRRKKGEGESGTQEAPETGCGQLFTSWRMIHLGVARLRNLWTFGAAARERKHRDFDTAISGCLNFVKKVP